MSIRNHLKHLNMTLWRWPMWRSIQSCSHNRKAVITCCSISLGIPWIHSKIRCFKSSVLARYVHIINTGRISFKDITFDISPRGGNLVLHDQVSKQAKRCSRNGAWVCLETITLPQCSAALTSTASQLQLQTLPYMTTVSVGAPRSRHDGFQIPKTAWHFWHTSTSMLI